MLEGDTGEGAKGENIRDQLDRWIRPMVQGKQDINVEDGDAQVDPFRYPHAAGHVWYGVGGLARLTWSASA